MIADCFLFLLVFHALGAFLDSAQNIINPGSIFLRLIENEMQLRHVAHAQADQQLALDISLGCVDGLNRLFRFVLIARNLNVNPRAFAVRRQRDLRHIAKRNARIAQLAFDDDADLFLQRLTYSRPMVRPARCSGMLFTSLRKTYEDTRENARKEAGPKIAKIAGIAKSGN